jgi:hypothetical protein
MKSTQRPSKPPKQHQHKSNDQSPKLDLVAYKPVEKQQPTSQPDPTKSNEPPQAELQAVSLNLPQSVHIDNKPLPLEKDKAERVYARDGLRPAIGDRKSDSPPQPKQRQFEPHEEEELLPQMCQHMQFIDCDKPVGRVVFECWHCKQGIINEFTGEPVIGEYKGRPSVVLTKVQCPSCGETAIRLSAKEVLSTTAISSPWK